MALGEFMLDINSQDMTEEEKNSHLLEILSKLGPSNEASDINYYDTVVDGYVFWVHKETLEIISKGADTAVDATKVTVKDASKTMTVYVGQAMTIEVDIEPEEASTRNVKYTSSDESKVTVSNGVVKGVAVTDSPVTITIKTKNGNTDTCEVTVREIEVSSISLDQSTLTVSVGSTSEAIGVTFDPSNATNKTITWSLESVSPSGCATVSNDGKVTGVAGGTATLKATTANGKATTCAVTVLDALDVPMSIADVKAAIQKDGLKAHLGQKVAYSPTGGGTWRVFYYNTEAKYGDPAGTLYIKRDYDDNLQTAVTIPETITANGTTYMTNMNPKWASYNDNEIDLKNEKFVSWLCDPDNWTNYKVNGVANYAIGGPGVEMYMDSFNTYKEKNNALVCEVTKANGYSVGANGTYTNSGNFTDEGTIEAGPKDLFMNVVNGWWLASPSSESYHYVLHAYEQGFINNGAGNIGLCPLVSINP